MQRARAHACAAAVAAAAITLSTLAPTLATAEDREPYAPAPEPAPTTSVHTVVDTANAPAGRRAAGRKITVTYAREAGPKDTVAVTGTAAKLAKAKVLLTQPVNQLGPLTLDRGRVSKTGAFELAVTAPADPGSYRYKLTFKPKAAKGPRASRPSARPRPVSTTLRLRVVKTSTTETPTVTPTPTPTPTGPLGSPTDWTYIGSTPTSPVRWNPCSPITWSYDPAKEPYAALGDATAALAKIAERTGLTFAYAGATGGKLTVQWSDAATHPGLAGTVLGLGGPSYYRVDPATNNGVERLAVSGIVIMDREGGLPAGFGGYGWGLVFTHEFMHALGLGHAAGKEQVMYPYIGPTRVFGAGDLSGLTAIGAAGGCLTPPAGSFRTAPPRTDLIAN